MSFGRKAAVSTLAIALAAYLVSGDGRPSLAYFKDSETMAATVSTAACFVADPSRPRSAARSSPRPRQYLPGVHPPGRHVLRLRQRGRRRLRAVRHRNGARERCDDHDRTDRRPARGGRVHGRRRRLHLSERLTTANAALAAGAKAYTITSTDNAANSQTQTGYSVTVDNTRPTGSTIQTANGSATPGKPEAGDSVILHLLRGDRSADRPRRLDRRDDERGRADRAEREWRHVDDPQRCQRGAVADRSVDLVGTAYVTATETSGRRGRRRRWS